MKAHVIFSLVTFVTRVTILSVVAVVTIITIIAMDANIMIVFVMTVVNLGYHSSLVGIVMFHSSDIACLLEIKKN